jgi:hypothetical protein
MTAKFVLICLLVMASRSFAQEVEGAPAGKVTTARKTVLQADPKPSGHVVRSLASGEQLRWIMGQKSNGFVRVMVAKGPAGWVPEGDLDKSQMVSAPVVEEALGASAQPCRESLTACPARGCGRRWQPARAGQ